MIPISLSQEKPFVLPDAQLALAKIKKTKKGKKGEEGQEGEDDGKQDAAAADVDVVADAKGFLGELDEKYGKLSEPEDEKEIETEKEDSEEDQEGLMKEPSSGSKSKSAASGSKAKAKSAPKGNAKSAAKGKAKSAEKGKAEGKSSKGKAAAKSAAKGIAKAEDKGAKRKRDSDASLGSEETMLQDMLNMPDCMRPEKAMKEGAKSYTVQYKHEYRVCVNLGKRAFWIYGGQLERRNFTWSHSDPKAAWAEAQEWLSI